MDMFANLPPPAAAAGNITDVTLSDYPDDVAMTYDAAPRFPNFSSTDVASDDVMTNGGGDDVMRFGAYGDYPDQNCTALMELFLELNKSYPPSQAVVPIVYCTICLLGLIGNGLVMFVIFGSKEMTKTIANIYIWNLALADTLFLVSLPFSATQRLMLTWPFGSLACKLVESVKYLNYFASIFFLTAMSVDRYIAVVYVVTSGKWRSSRNTFFVCAGIWLVSLVLVIPLLMYTKLHGGFCALDFNPNEPEVMTSYGDHMMLDDVAGMEYDVTYDEEDCSKLQAYLGGEETFPFPLGDVPQIANGETPREILPGGLRGALDGMNNNLSGENATGDDHPDNDLSGLDLAKMLAGKAPGGRDPDNDLSGQDLETMFGEKNLSGEDEKVLCKHAESRTFHAYLVFTFVAGFVAPFSIITVCYVLIVVKLLQPTEIKTRFRQAEKKRRKVTRMVVGLVVSFFVCWLPFYVWHLVLIGGIYVSRGVCYNIRDFTFCLGFANSCLNPILYTFLGHNFRERLQKSIAISLRSLSFTTFTKYTSNTNSRAETYPHISKRNADGGIVHGEMARGEKSTNNHTLYRVKEVEPTQAERLIAPADPTQSV